VWKTRKDAGEILCFGILGMSMCQYTYFTAIGASNAGTATVLQYIGPVIIVVYVSLRTLKLPGPKEICATILAVLGTFFLATHGDPESLVLSEKALFWDLASAAALAVYTVQPGRLLPCTDALKDRHNGAAILCKTIFQGTPDIPDYFF